MAMIYNSILSAAKVGIFTHMNPDGDALGSTIGLMGYLDSLGKESTIFIPSLYGESLSFMIPQQSEGRIVVWNESNKDEICDEISRCDLLIGLDFNTLERIGEFGPILAGSSAVKILIDHHVGPDTVTFDQVYSRTQVSSACELLFSILMDSPQINGDCTQMTEMTRNALMTGMTTDTNNFANSVFPSTFTMASQLIEAGTDRNAIVQNLFFSYPTRRIKAQGYILDRLLHITEQGVAYIILDWPTQEKFGLQEGDTEGFVNIPLSAAEVRMSIFLKEESNRQKIRVSIRSKEGTSARDAAMKYFHGGGHVLASGGKLMVGQDIGCVADAAYYIEENTRNFFLEQ